MNATEGMKSITDIEPTGNESWVLVVSHSRRVAPASGSTSLTARLPHAVLSDSRKTAPRSASLRAPSECRRAKLQGGARQVGDHRSPLQMPSPPISSGEGPSGAALAETLHGPRRRASAPICYGCVSQPARTPRRFVFPCRRLGRSPRHFAFNDNRLQRILEDSTPFEGVLECLRRGKKFSTLWNFV